MTILRALIRPRVPSTRRITRLSCEYEHQLVSVVFRHQYGEPAGRKIVMELRWKAITQWMSWADPGIAPRTGRDENSSGSCVITEEVGSFVVQPRARVRAAVRNVILQGPIGRFLWPYSIDLLEESLTTRLFDLFNQHTTLVEIKLALYVERIKETLVMREALRTEMLIELALRSWPGFDEIRGDETSSEKCVICMEELDPWRRAIRMLPCFHRFHEDCISSWLQQKDSCPSCRRSTSITLSVLRIPLNNSSS